MSAQWSAALAVLLLGVAAFATGSPLQLMVMEKAAAAPPSPPPPTRPPSTSRTRAARIGGLALAAGLGATAPAVVGAGLAVIGLGVAAVAYTVDTRRAAAAAPQSLPSRGRVVASHVPGESEPVRV